MLLLHPQNRLMKPERRLPLAACPCCLCGSLLVVMYLLFFAFDLLS